MSAVKSVIKRQYARLADQAAKTGRGIAAPPEGWIATLRKALGMSAPTLARRMGITKASIYQAERMERDGGVTLDRMERIAEALGGRFVYAIIPDESVDAMMQAQARLKAEAIVKRAGVHMALEKQALNAVQTEEEINRITEELLRDMPRDFWEAP
eukprot:Skav233283  [mRNA]  locus=scaffold7558:2923:3390:- [translate_table: standard]